MPTRAVEEAHLFQARVHVASAQAHIAHQVAVIAKRRVRGLDTRRSEQMLRTMQETLRVMQAHEELIEDVLGQHDAATTARAAIHSILLRQSAE